MTTATCEHITKEQIASEQERVRYGLMRFVNEITNDCKTIARKYQDFVDGEYPDAKPYLIHSAATNLAIMAGQIPEDAPATPIRVARREDADAKDKDAPKPKKPKITMKELTNWEMGRATRAQTNNCLDLAQALYDMLDAPYVFPSANPDELKYQKATQIKPHHEFRALQELSKRGHGSENPYSYAKTSAAEERMLHDRLSDKIREIDSEGVKLVTHMLHMIRNPKHNAWGEIITTPYTQTQRLWCIKHLLWRGVDIPWEHITHDDIQQYYRDLEERERLETERLLAQSAPKEPAPLTPEQEASVMALLDETARHAEQSERRAAKKAQKKAKKAAKKTAATKRAALDGNNPANRKSNGNDSHADAANRAAPADNTSDTRAPAPESDRGPTAVANALARHPQVDLDTALENHHSTAGIPKEDLTHEQIYDAITAEANFQKRQAIIQNQLREKTSNNAPEDNAPPKTRSP